MLDFINAIKTYIKYIFFSKMETGVCGSHWVFVSRELVRLVLLVLRLQTLELDFRFSLFTSLLNRFIFY